MQKHFNPQIIILWAHIATQKLPLLNVEGFHIRQIEEIIPIRHL